MANETDEFADFATQVLGQQPQVPEGEEDFAAFAEGVLGQQDQAQRLQAQQQQRPSPVQAGGADPRISQILSGVPETGDPVEGLKKAGKFIAKEGPRTVGAIVGAGIGFAAGAPAGPVGAAAGAVAGAGIGGAGGEAARQALLSLIDSPEAPDSFEEGLKRTARAGVEEALLEGPLRAGGLALDLFRFGRPTRKPGAAVIGERLELEGGGLSLGESTENLFVQNIENLIADAPIGGGPFKVLSQNNLEASVRLQDTLLDTIIGGTDRLTRGEVGILFLDTIKKGQRAHTEIAKPMFANMDNLVPTRIEQRQVTRTSDIIDPTTGKPTVTRVLEDVEVGPVNLQSVANFAEKQGSRVLPNLGATETGQNILASLRSLAENPNLTFKEAHDLRSRILTLERNLPKETKAQLGGVLKKTSKLIDEAMGVAAKDSPIEGAFDSWRQADKFWKFGKRNLNNKLITKMLKKEDTPSKIGKFAFRAGNVEEIEAVRRAIKTSSVLDKSVNFKKTWNKVQGGYLEGLLVQPGGQIADSKIMSLTRNPELKITFEKVFDLDQKRAIKGLTDAFDFTTQQATARGTMLQWRQTGAVLSAGGVATAAQGGGNLVSLLLAPPVLSRLLTNPSIVRALTRAQKLDPLDPIALSIFARIQREAERVEAAVEREQQGLPPLKDEIRLPGLGTL